MLINCCRCAAFILLLFAAICTSHLHAQTIRRALFTAEQPQDGCREPAAVSQFSLSTTRIYFWFLVDGTFAGDTFRVEWTAGDSQLYTTHTWTPLSAGGSWCFQPYITPAASNIPLSKVGVWTAVVFRNNSRMATATFRLLNPAEQRPSFLRTGVVDPWNYKQILSPGSWISIYGQNLAIAPALWMPSANERLPTEVGGVSVKIAGIPSPISYVSGDLVNLLVPGNTPEGDVDIVVERGGLASPPIRVYASRASPTLYSVPGAVQPLKFYVTAALAGTSELVGTGQVDPRVSRGVRPGDLIDIYAIGAGRTRIEFPTDRYFTGAYAPVEQMRIYMGTATLIPQFAALVAPGLYLIRVRVPQLFVSQDAEIRLACEDIISPERVYITFENGVSLTTLRLSSDFVRGGQSITGQVTISQPAPIDGARISLRSNNSRVRMPAAINIDRGSRTATFTITTDPMTAAQNVIVTAVLADGVMERQAVLAVQP